MPISTDAVFRKVLLDRRTPMRLKLQALAAMARPSLRLLYKLTADRSPKVRFAAAQRLAVENTRKELRKNARQRNLTADSQRPA